jgi:hypothetical protein
VFARRGFISNGYDCFEVVFSKDLEIMWASLGPNYGCLIELKTILSSTFMGSTLMLDPYPKTSHLSAVRGGRY